METLWDGTNHASLSYSQGRVCPSPSHTNPPRCASDSAITSRWFKGKKHTCQESAKTLEWHPTTAAIRWTFPRDNLTCPLMRLLPPLNTLLVWHISHSAACTGAAGAGRSAGAGGSASIHQSETRLVELGRTAGGFWFGVNGNRGACPGGEQGGGGGSREDGAGWGSHGDPSSSPGQHGAPLPVLLLG